MRAFELGFAAKKKNEKVKSWMRLKSNHAWPLELGFSASSVISITKCVYLYLQGNPISIRELETQIHEYKIKLKIVLVGSSVRNS